MSTQRPSLYSSAQAFRATFEHGLEHLLDGGGLNGFILVLANAGLDQGLLDRLLDRLHDRYEILRGELNGSQHGYAESADEDDVQVLREIARIGFDSLRACEWRRTGPWEVQFNPLRAMRPMRNSQRPVSSIHRPFDETGFHFNKPFMRDETIWSGELLGQAVDLFYNKYPFVDLHGLLVPAREQCLPQYMTRDLHDYTWRLVQFLGATIPHLKVAYNAFGAYASVNHLHLQLCVRPRPFPVEYKRWAHNGGGTRYPVECQVFAEPGPAWALIERLHEQNRAYNLLYSPECLYVVPRRKQGGFALPAWSNGFSWYEVCGGMITFDRCAFLSLPEAEISQGLARLVLDGAH